jgi:hypothetical protein
MIISHKYRYIYIQNRKVGGSSVQAYLSSISGKDDIVTSPTGDPKDSKNIYGIWNPLPDYLYGTGLKQIMNEMLNRQKYQPHMPGTLVRSRVSKKIWDQYFKFCIERNPWEKTLSHFYMKSKRPDRKHWTLDEYLKGKTLCSDFNRYTDKKGDLLVDKVILYEDLENNLNEAFERLGIPYEGMLGFNINSNFREDRRHYREVFTPEQRRIVERVYHNEIQMFGYTY